MRYIVLIGLAALMVSAAGANQQTVRINPYPIAEDVSYPHYMAAEISPPWDQEGVWVLRAPETIGCNFGVLFIDHSRMDMPPLAEPIGKLAWETARDNTMSYECKLDNGASFKVELVPGERDITILSSLTNKSENDLSNLATQFCLTQTGVNGFEDPMAQRTFVLVDGEFVALGKTKPGIEEGQKPIFILTSTKKQKRCRDVPIERSWVAQKQTDIPLIATVSEDGKHVVAVAFETAYKIMTNCEIPCIHADARYPECKKGNTTHVKGKIYFIEGSIEDVVPLFYEDFPQWKPREKEEPREPREASDPSGSPGSS